MKRFHFITSWLLIVVTCCILAGCKTKYIEVPSIHYETVTKRDTVSRVDSIYQHDSVWVNQYIKGDTVVQEKYRYKILYKDRWREKIAYRDSIVRDSIPYKVEVEKPLTRLQKTFIGIGKILGGILFALLLAAIVQVILRVVWK